MREEPWFWRERTIAARAASLALAPASLGYDAAQRLRAALVQQTSAPAPVFCVGNATLGGVGKTPFALMLADRLAGLGAPPHFLTRGFGGALSGPVQVDPATHTALDVGDEALLLAASCPTWVSRNRPAGAHAAVASGAGTIVMDDGFQNPSLEKTLSFLLIDSGDPQGNGAVFPSGPLREPMQRAMARADIVVFVSRGTKRETPSETPAEKPVFQASLEPAAHIEPRRVTAFCGVGAPQGFFSLLDSLGFDIAGRYPFPDHRTYTPAEISRLQRIATENSSTLITTAKDFVRLPRDLRDGIEMLPVHMRIDGAERLDHLLSGAVARFRHERRAP